MSPELHNRIARDYVRAFAEEGAPALIANLKTSVGLHQWGEQVLPITINDGTPARTFVCSPRVGYFDYTREELSRFPSRVIALILRPIIDTVSLLTSTLPLDKIVHVNNWMMSTNLPVDLDPSLANSQTIRLVESYPEHLLAMRSLTERYNRELLAALKAAGWILLPSRQVFLVDDVKQQCVSRRDLKRDAKLWQHKAYTYEELDQIGPVDAERIVELYELLYLEKYSRLNPGYTVRFILLTHRIGLIRYLVLRDRRGVIQAFGGMHRFGNHATMPLLGYNTLIPQEQGLYRLAFYAGCLYAAHHDLRLNMSSGATQFKRSRGATAEMEFTAFYSNHLPLAKRLPMGALRCVANQVGIPILKKYQL